MATTVTPSAYTFFKNSSTGVSTVVGYEDSSERGIRYTFKLPSSCTAGATSYSFTKTSNSLGGGTSGLRWNWAVSTSSTAYLNTTGAGQGYKAASSSFSSGSTSMTLLPNTTYYLFIYPGSTTYGWYYWNYPESNFTLTVDGSITYTVKYNANGGSGAPGNQTKTHGTALTLSSTKPTRTGYTFKGWATSASGSVAYAAGASYTANAGVTLYAVWQINSYTLYVYPQGGTWASSTSSQTFSLNYGATKTIAPPTRTGYTFGGWMWSYYGAMSNSSFNQSALLSTSHGITVYDNNNSGTISLSWTDNPSTPTLYGKDYITIKKVSGTASPNLGGFKRTVTPAAGTTYYHTFYAKVPTGYTLVRNNNSISGTFTWLTDQAGTGDWKIYAYKLVVNASPTNLGTFGFISLKSDAGSTTTAVTWYLGANQITKSITSNQTFTTQAGDTWMYASWIPNKYTVTFNKNGGGTPSFSSKTVYYDDTYGDLPTVSRTGYTFAGWYTAASGGTKVTTSTKVAITANQTLYAHWKINQYTLTLTKGTGISAVSGAGTYDYNASVTINATVKTGYTWKNWTSGSTAVTTTKNYTFNMPANNLSYTANATANTYSIQYNGNGATGGSMSDSTHTYDTAKNLSANAYTRAGYEFLGWATTSTGEVAYTDKESVKNLTATNGDVIVLFAVWKPLSQMFIWHDGAWHRALRYVYTTQ